MAKTTGKDVVGRIQDTPGREVATRQSNFEGFMRGELAKVYPTIKNVVPKHMTPERLTRMALTTISRTPKLAECTPESLVGAVMNCATLGLEPNLIGHAYLVPFKNNKTGRMEAQFQIGYKGYIDLIRRTGEVSQVYGKMVRENDVCVYLLGERNGILHVPFEMLEHFLNTPINGGDILVQMAQQQAQEIKSRNPESAGEVEAYYSAYKLKDGSFGFETLSKQQALAHANKFSKSKYQGNLVGPWKDHFDEMALKTVFKKMVKFMPITIEEKVATDEAVVKPNQHSPGEVDSFFDAEYSVVEDNEPDAPEPEQAKPPEQEKKDTPTTKPANDKPAAPKQANFEDEDVPDFAK